jgi:hypothetical protein
MAAREDAPFALDKSLEFTVLMSVTNPDIRFRGVTPPPFWLRTAPSRLRLGTAACGSLAPDRRAYSL